MNRKQKNSITREKNSGRHSKTIGQKASNDPTRAWEVCIHPKIVVRATPHTSGSPFAHDKNDSEDSEQKGDPRAL